VESDLVEALRRIAILVRLHAEGDERGRRIDVLSLSMGYYHETPEDLLFDTTMLDILTDLAAHGVVVVCSAGNDATSRPSFPAAFAPWSDGEGPVKADPALVPVVSVGALNPNRVSDALFSNAGPWVRVYLPGASVMSTMPPFQGGYEPIARTRAFGRVRESIDPDDFRGGFAVWSGTSFAAPMLAGVFANFLAPKLENVGESSVPGPDAVKRAWGVITKTTKIRKPRVRKPS
jgi:serine protease